MAIDPSIALQVRPIQFDNPLEIAQRGMTLRQLALQNQAGERQMRDQQALSDAYRGAIGEDGGVDYGKVQQSLAQAGTGYQIPGVVKARLDTEKAQADLADTKAKTQASEIASDEARNRFVYSLAQQVLSNPNAGHDEIIQALAQAPQQYAQNAAQLARTLPADPAMARRFVLHLGLTAQQNLEALTPKPEKVDTGGAVQFVDTNPNTNPNPAPITKTMTPGEVATANNQAATRQLEREKFEYTKSGALTQAAKELAVERLLAGEKPPEVLGNIGRGQQGAQDLRAIQNLLAETAKARGIDARGIIQAVQATSADARTMTELGAREGKIAPRVQEAQNFAQIALEASAAVPRGNFLPWNKLAQMSATQLQDPNLARLKAATVSLINAYASAVNGGGPGTVHDKETAENMLSAAQSPEAYSAVVQQLLKETQGALDAPGQVRARVQGQHVPAAPAAGAAPAGQGARPPLDAILGPPK